ncbi:MAG: NADH-quinone oxidoreductase subunit J [Candidatus Lightella neohaematopini]|nr:NADH-quinone oxidoreductase subunit J [Candidatus Lightella neohaematopini]
MILLFYIATILLIIVSVLAVFTNNIMHALLYFASSLCFTSCILFLLKMELAGILEIILYANAIVVLFTVIIMLFNENSSNCIIYKKTTLCMLIPLIMLILLIYINNINFTEYKEILFTIHDISIFLFQNYILLVELISLLLLTTIVLVLCINRK